MRKIIFHYPGLFYDVLNTGEKKRPKMMYEAFLQLGFEVTAIVGTYQERKSIFRSIKNEISEYDFLYSENSTLPLRFTGAKHLPIFFNNSDFKLFKLVKKNNIPSAVFFRDIYWNFPGFRQKIGCLKYLLSMPFYKEELQFYANNVNKIFVPSEKFINITSAIQSANYSILPPAFKLYTPANNKLSNTIKLIYVGSIAPPIYDISNLLNALESLGNTRFELTIVTRKNDWQQYNNYYKIQKTTKVLHIDGKELQKHLRLSDISLIYLKQNDYRKMCMPLKLFEAIGYGLPVISYGDSAVSDFVKENNIGWVVSENSQKNIFEYILKSPDEIKEKRENVEAIQEQHTWQKRAKKVAEVLIGS